MNPEIVKAFRFITLSTDLTEQGLINYQKVIAIVFEWIRTVKDEWLAGDIIDAFLEKKIMADLSYKIYTVPSQDENVVALSEAMLVTRDPSKLLEQSYTEPIIPEIDQQDVRAFLNDFTYDKCKIVLNGNDMFKRKDVKLTKMIRDKQ